MPPSVVLRRFAYRCAHLLLHLYWFLAGPEIAGVKCVLTDGDRVLLVMHTYGPRSWDLPGGTIKRGEPPANAARREMSEELGLAFDDWKAIGQVRGQVSRRRDTLHCFQREVHDPVLTLDLGELEDVRWVPAHSLPPRVGRYVPQILALLA